jgi:parallel beta-helix repeat protein
MAGFAEADIVTVGEDGTWDRIQEGINAAGEGDTVAVQYDPQNGTNYEENVVFGDSNILLISTDDFEDLNPDPELCIIDGNSQDPVISCTTGLTNSTEIQGFTITDGKGIDETVLLHLRLGGGIYYDGSSPKVTSCRVYDNDGSGIHCESGPGCIIQDCEIDSNAGCGITCLHSACSTISSNKVRWNKQTGIYCYNGSSPSIISNTISYNGDTTFSGIGNIDYGGGICLDGTSPQQYPCNPDSITSNTITENISPRNGGGIMIMNSCTSAAMRIAGNTMEDNKARYCGGGIFCHWNVKATIDSNSICGNEASLVSDSSEGGGGIYCTGLTTSPKILRNVVSDNTSHTRGGAMSILGKAKPWISRNIITGNSADSGGNAFFIAPGT